MAMIGGGDAIASQCRTPEIMADAAYYMLAKPLNYTGNFAIDEDVLRAEGVTNFDKYAMKPGKLWKTSKIFRRGFMCRQPAAARLLPR